MALVDPQTQKKIYKAICEIQKGQVSEVSPKSPQLGRDVYKYLLGKGLIPETTPIIIASKNSSPKTPGNGGLPVIFAGVDVVIIAPNDTVTLTGSITGVDYSEYQIAWDNSLGPAECVIVSPDQLTTDVTGLIPGLYRFNLSVIDTRGNIYIDSVNVVVAPAINLPPIIDAGEDVTLTLPTSLTTLSATIDDEDSTSFTYLWEKIAGPDPYNIVSPTEASTEVNGLVEGNYVFKVTVTDDGSNAVFDTLNVVVVPPVNIPPTADAGSDKEITLPTNSTTLTGSGVDTDGTIIQYLWTKVSGPISYNIVSPSNASTVINGLVEGTYVFSLQVKDNQNAIDTDQVTVIVNPEPIPLEPPVANAGDNISITLPTDTVNVNGSGSTDSDGTIVSYAWSKISGPSTFSIDNPTNVSTSISSLVEGTYVFRLTVTDNDGLSSFDDITIVVNPVPNVPPTANAGANVSITLPIDSASLSGVLSTDSDGTITGYLWSQIVGPSSATIGTPTTVSTTVDDLIEGTYTFRLTVTDNDGATSTDDVDVIVNEAPNVAPVARAGDNVTITLPTDSTTLDGTASTDSDGTIVSYLWTKISGPTSSTIATPSGSTTLIDDLEAGTYVFRLTVTDNDGAASTDDVTILVQAAPPPNELPIANAGANKNITLPTNSVSVDGSGSTDSDGTITDYLWTKISGPATYTIVSPTSAITTINNLVEGSYIFRLTVTDDDADSDSDDVTVVVNPAPNVPPTANAGASKNITLPTNSVSMVGSGNDTDGTIVAYAWTKISGPATFTITSPSSASTTITGLVQGTYTFRLTVTDDDGATGTDDVLVTVNPAPNVPPVSNAGANQTITLPTSSVSLNGSGSTDSDGTITTYAWTRVSGPNTPTITSPSTANTSVTGLIQGVYVFRLTVTDNDGATDADDITVTVNAAPNVPPNANAGSDTSIQLPTNSVGLNGTGSSDSDGTIVSYSWSKVSGPSYTISNANVVSPTVSNLLQGTYIFRLTVTDDDGATATDDVTVVVNPATPPPNEPPIARAGNDIVITLPTSSTSVNGNTSTDPDGSIVSYLWTKISGPASSTIGTPTAVSTTITGLVQGTYVFRLTVTDDDGATDTDDIEIRVDPAPNVLPNANAGSDISINLPTNTVSLNGSASNDPDGTISAYLWSKVSGPVSGTIASPAAVITNVNGLVQGNYVFNLRVTDNRGGIDNDTVGVAVNAPIITTPRVGALFQDINGSAAMAKLDSVNLQLIRAAVTLTNNPINNVINSYLNNGYYVQLNVNWKTGHPTGPYQTNMTQYEGLIRQTFDHYVDYIDQIPLVVCENEWDNVNYHSGDLAAYLPIYDRFVSVAHEYGFKVSDAGFTNNSIKRWTYSKITDPVKQQQWKNNYFVGLNNDYEAFVAKMDQVLTGIGQIPGDYINFHWYNLQENVYAEGLPTCMLHYTQATGRTYNDIVNNEFGIRNVKTQTLWEKTVNELKQYIKIGLAYSGIDSPGLAVELTDEMLLYWSQTTLVP